MPVPEDAIALMGGEGWAGQGPVLEDGSIPSEACLIERMNAIGPKFNVKQVEGPSPL